MKKIIAQMSSSAITLVALTIVGTSSAFWLNKPQAPQELLQK